MLDALSYVTSQELDNRAPHQNTGAGRAPSQSADKLIKVMAPADENLAHDLLSRPDRGGTSNSHRNQPLAVHFFVAGE